MTRYAELLQMDVTKLNTVLQILWPVDKAWMLNNV